MLLNRRDYQGSLPIPKEEVEALAAAAAGTASTSLPAEMAQTLSESISTSTTSTGADDGDTDAPRRKAILAYKRTRSREFFDFLCAFAQNERVALCGPDGVCGGGIVIVGWSAGTMLINGLLANIARFESEGGFDLRPYIKRAVLYGEHPGSPMKITSFID